MKTDWLAWWLFGASRSSMAIAEVVFAGLNGKLDKLKAGRMRIKGAVPDKENAIGNANNSESIKWRTCADARPFLDEPG